MSLEGSSCYEAALAYADLGFVVFPYAWLSPDGACSCGCRDLCCRRRGKHPHPEGAERGRRGSNDRAQLGTWWETWPQANVGIDCRSSGLVVLDVDPRKGGARSLAVLRERVGESALRTSTVLTSSGGCHLYYRTPAHTAFDTRRNWPLTGIDTISGGLQVTAPPSLHPSGVRYRWAEGLDPWTVEPIPLPAAIEEMLAMRPGLAWRTASVRYSLPNLELRCRVRRLTQQFSR